VTKITQSYDIMANWPQIIIIRIFQG